MRAGRRFVAADSTLIGLVAISVVAIALRLVDLGGRIAHWDEARVAYDAIRYQKTGVWQYRPIVHGPFLPKVNNEVFAVLDASDASMRLIVVLIGGLAPLAAYLFRHHLDRVEVLALGILLAANPLLLYYSRFYRNDVALAVVMLVAFGLFVRAHDTRRSIYLYPAMAAVALGFTMKGNALLYPIVWIGAIAVVLDHRALGLGRTSTARDRAPPLTVMGERLGGAARGLWAWRRDVVGSLFLGLTIFVAFYTPRGPHTIGYSDVLLAPWRLPAFLDQSLVDPVTRLLDYWVGGPTQDTPYLPFLLHYIETLAAGALVIVGFAVLGFLADRYDERGSRPIVAIAGLWGFVSILGYPIAADIQAPWLAVHAIVPLAIPAAVGLALVYRAGRDALADDDRIGVATAAVVLVLAAVLIAQPAITLVYLHPTAPDNQLAQYAQPGGDWEDTIDVMHALAETNDGTDVLYVGERLYMVDEDDAYLKPASGGWYDRLPLPWYEEQVDATSDSAIDPEVVADLIEADAPPVVIVEQGDGHLVDEHLEGYEVRTHQLRLVGFYIDIYLDVDRLDES